MVRTGEAQVEGAIPQDATLEYIEQLALASAGVAPALDDGSFLIPDAAPEVTADGTLRRGLVPIATNAGVAAPIAGTRVIAGNGDGQGSKHLAGDGLASVQLAGDGLAGDQLAGDDAVAGDKRSRRTAPRFAVIGTVQPQPAQVTRGVLAQLSLEGLVTRAGSHDGYSVTVMV